METTIILIGVSCVIAAIVGGGIKLHNLEVGSVPSLWRQLLLGAFGILLSLLGLRGLDPTPDPSPTFTDQPAAYDDDGDTGDVGTGIDPNAPTQTVSAAQDESDSGPIFAPPRLDGRTIDGCISSSEYPEAQNEQCSEQAQRVIASAFCARKDYSVASRWSAQNLTNAPLSYKYKFDFVDNAVEAEWVPTSNGLYMFTSIECV